MTTTEPTRDNHEREATLEEQMTQLREDLVTITQRERQGVTRTIELEGRVAQLTRTMEQEKNNFEAWKRRATEIAHEFADRHNLCSVFDDVMEEIGLEPRTREWDVNISVTLTVRTRVTARNAEEARENEIDAQLVRTTLRDTDADVLVRNMDDWEVIEVEES